MQKNLYTHIEANNFILKHISKVLGQFLRVDNLDIAVGLFSQLPNSFDFASLTFDGDDIHSHIFRLGSLSKFSIELLFLLSIWLQLSNTDIG